MKTQKQPTAATTSVTTDVAPSANWSRATVLEFILRR